MIALGQFQGPVLVAGVDSDDARWAFRMDGGQNGVEDLREHAQLNECGCAAYFRRIGDAVAFLNVADIAEECKQVETSFVPWAVMKPAGYSLRRYADALVIRELCSRVSVSMLMLCRIAAHHNDKRFCREVQKEMRGDKFAFWLVVSNDVKPSDLLAIDSLKFELEKGLRGILKDVKVMLSDDFAGRYDAATRP